MVNWNRRTEDCELERPIRIFVPAGEAEPVASNRSWTTRVRGAPSTYEVAQYTCPVHGRFLATVLRPALLSMPCGCGAESAQVYPSPGLGVSSGEVTS